MSHAVAASPVKAAPRSYALTGKVVFMGHYKRQSIAASEPTAAATLADMLDEGLSIFCWCNRCGHNAVLDPLPLVDALGRLFPVPELGTRMRCSRCQTRDITTRPAWPAYGGGQMTRHL